ncbi:MAG TPA: hypothetical protein PK093_12900, partial [Phycisphaerae bacterium]|nr:hypothetical protein [Phycisphaerae bacterium]
HDSFVSELAPSLRAALITEQCQPLLDFINRHHDLLTSPREGAPIGDDWIATLSSRDAHQFGAIALTKFYSPSQEMGLGAGWKIVDDILVADGRFLASPILGDPFDADGVVFDPGGMGAYFQSPSMVRTSLGMMRTIARYDATPEVVEAVTMLERAARAGAGLYVTF